MTQSLAQFAALARNGVADHLRSNLRKGVEDGALHGKRHVQAQLRLAGVSGGKLRNVGLKGSRVGVRYDNIVGTDNPSTTLRATGRGFQLIERDTRPHVIAPRRRGRRALSNAAKRGERATNRRAVMVPGVGPRARVMHPGTAGKHPFERGIQAATPGIRRAIGTSFVRTF